MSTKNRLNITLLLAFPLMSIFPSHAYAWKLIERTDKITDVVVKTTVVTSAEGATFTVVRQTDNSVWAYVKLAGFDQFMVNEKLVLRIDKNTPIDFSDSLQEVSTRLGRPIHSWEWNPSLIGFRLWHGNPESGRCGQVTAILKGFSLIVRYHPNQSTTRDLTFDISENKASLLKALDLRARQCITN